MNSSKHYQKPTVEIVELSVERGFSDSDSDSGSLPQLPTIGPWEGWTRSLMDFTLEAGDYE